MSCVHPRCGLLTLCLFLSSLWSNPSLPPSLLLFKTTFSSLAILFPSVLLRSLFLCRSSPPMLLLSLFMSLSPLETSLPQSPSLLKSSLPTNLMCSLFFTLTQTSTTQSAPLEPGLSQALSESNFTQEERSRKFQSLVKPVRLAFPLDLKIPSLESIVDDVFIRN